MSKPIDYSKFNHINDSDSDTDGVSGTAVGESSSSLPPMPIARTKKSQHNGRYIFECNGQKVYEWEQNLDEVNMYIDTPPIPDFKPSMLDICIEPKKLKVGLKGHDRYFIDEETFSKIDTSESTWYLDTSEDSDDTGVIHVVLIKAFRGEVWDSALCTRASIVQAGDNSDGSTALHSGSSTSVDPLTREQIKREMMLERFQEENPHFDFRSAEFNGDIPDPRSFMGGVSYKR